ncbi:YciI family protein [Mongoliitalea daihaiensis]|uniref:YciI family protein n=1 Tax=Mongoliitalea daihaiensis TaxID=2782006 RepID=UPI001F42FFB9|nr:YciI family protein [Mongoliitalea daihaiensis]UJP63345.1 hypothetical protein IPZ59_10835 [Mongoliitalea daihaiensis]
MKNHFLTLLMTLGLFSTIFAQQTSYEETLAKELQADDYGMKTYVMAILLAGDRADDYSPEQRTEIQKGHMANINRLAEDGKLILAGPFIDGKEKRGIFLFNVATKEEAEALTNTDPAIQAGVLKMELIEWYASAALQLLPEAHKKIQKTGF